MDTGFALQAQLDSLQYQLFQVEKAIQSLKLDTHLRNRVGPRFDTLLSRKGDQILELRQQVSNSQSLEASWNQFRQLNLDCRRLFEECLAFIQGALARANAVDEGMCLLADNLLDDLSIWADVGWRRFTLLSTGEFYRDTADIIRIRYPELSFWTLPVVAHEFGHFLGPELKENQNGSFEYPFQKKLKEADENRPVNWPLPHSSEWHYLHEHFADLFATYSLGPAFVSSFILLRLDPVDANQDGPTHPSHAKRVHSIFWLLERMDRAGGLMRPYRALIDLLRNLWQQSMQDIDQSGVLSDIEIALLELKLDTLHDLLIRATPSRLAYQLSDWQRSQMIAGRLLSNQWSLSDQDNGELTRRDVLNAAWLGRLQIEDPKQYRVSEIADRALELYRLIPLQQL